MFDQMNLNEEARASVVRAKPLSIGRRLLGALENGWAAALGWVKRRALGALTPFAVGGVFTVTCVGADGVVKWVEKAHNQVKTEGLNHMLGVVFKGSSQVTTWYIGLITAGGTTSSAGDTLGSHAGWTENATYSGNRVAWDEGSASGGVITSSTTSDFTMTGDATVGGIFVSSAASGTSGTLWSTADFASSQILKSGDVLKVTYTLTATSSS